VSAFLQKSEIILLAQRRLTLFLPWLLALPMQPIFGLFLCNAMNKNTLNLKAKS